MRLTPSCFGTYPTTPQSRAENDCYACADSTNCIEYTHNLNRVKTMTQATSTDTILAERGQRYGKFIHQGRISQTLKGVIKAEMGAEKWDYLASDQKEALDMICHKIARIVNGDPNYHDSWADIAGYAKLVADRLETGVEK